MKLGNLKNNQSDMCDSHTEQCAICLQELGIKNRFTTECGHTFCGSCMITNLHHSSKCPMCRAVLDENSSRLRGGGDVLTDVEVEQTANMLVSAMNTGEQMAKKIFDALPTRDWETLPQNIQHAIKGVIQNELIQFTQDFHMFIHPEEGNQPNPPPLEEESDSDDDLYAPPPQRYHVPERHNTVISRPVEIPPEPELDPTLTDLVRELDIISDEPRQIRDVNTDVDTDVDVNLGSSTQLLHIINNTIINNMESSTPINTNYAIINWERLDLEPIPRLE